MVKTLDINLDMCFYCTSNHVVLYIKKKKRIKILSIETNTNLYNSLVFLNLATI